MNPIAKVKNVEIVSIWKQKVEMLTPKPYKRPMQNQSSILIVDDDPLWLITLEEKFSSYGNITKAESKAAALRLLQSRKFDIAFFDLDLEERLGGLDLVAFAKSIGLYNVILSSTDTTDIIKKGYLLGCVDYLIKPISDEALRLVFKKYHLLGQSEWIEKVIKENFITKNRATLDSLEIIKRINLSDKSILITGESGTGKTCLAKIIHRVTCSKNAPFVSLNCSQFNESTLDSELFGHVKGSFTGAIRDRKGVIEQSQGGTLFLDEVHSLGYRAQQKLLKALDEGIIYPVGAEKPIHVQFKVICATCENLEDLIAKNEFRRDLYYRIKTFALHLRPLKERKEDILPLVHFYLDKKERKMVLSEEVEEALVNYHWPANTREIEDLVENWYVLGPGIIELHHLPKSFLPNNDLHFSTKGLITQEQMRFAEERGLKAFMDLMKKEAIEWALGQNDGKQNEAAKKLKISKSTMSKSLDKLKESEVTNACHY